MDRGLMDEPDCNPEICPRAKGHFDRINDAVFDELRQIEEKKGIARKY